MKRAIPTIEMHMTSSPHSIGFDQTLETARSVLRKYKIRHLPVMRVGEVVGLISSRDLDFVESLPGVDPAKLTVGDAMSHCPYCVAPETPLDEVALEMARRRFGCAVVKRGGKVIGVFTTVDAMRVLGEHLRRDIADEKMSSRPSRSRRAATRRRVRMS